MGLMCCRIINDLKYGSIPPHLGHRSFLITELMKKITYSFLALISFLVLSSSADEEEIDSKVIFRGKVVYERNCQICQQANGEGIRLAFPPLTGTPWVTGSKERLIKLVVYGLSGPIIVKGREFSSKMIEAGIPPGSLTDADIAYLLTYIRNAWGNSASEVKESEVIDVKEQVGDRKNAWDSEDLLKLHPLKESE